MSHLAVRPLRFDRLAAPAAALLLGACSLARPEQPLPHAAPTLPSVVAQRLVEGGPNPGAVTVLLANHGTCALQWAATIVTVDGRPWVAVAPANGVVAPGGSTPLALSFDVVTTGLLPATYTGTLSVSGTCQSTGQAARGSPRDVALNLVVTPQGFDGGVADAGGGDRWVDFVGTVVPTARRDARAASQDLGDGVDSNFVTLLFGGSDGGSLVADPFLYRSDAGWSDLSALVGAPAARRRHTLTAVTSEFPSVVVWGGETDAGVTSTGAVLSNPGALQWTPTTQVGAPSARAEHSATWQMPRLVIWGGVDATGQVLQTGGRYGVDFDNWLPMTTVNAPAARRGHLAAFDDLNFQVLVWGGVLASGLPTNTGGRYSAATDTWLGMATTGAPSARTGATAVWTGAQWLVWGGRDASGVRNDGAAYDPTTDTWTALPASGAPSAREQHSVVWTGTVMIVWGGLDGSGAPLDTGGVFDPAGPSWAPVSTVGAPAARAGHAAVWHEDRMLVTAGQTGTGPVGGGRAYQP